MVTFKILLSCALGACILLFLILLIIARRKANTIYESYEHEAIEISKRQYKTLSLSERYAIIFIFSAFKENIKRGVRDLAIAIHQIEFEAQTLSVKEKDANAFFQAEGKQGVEHAVSLLADIKDKDKNIIDFLVYRCHVLVKMAGGINRQYNMSCKEISERLFFRMFNSIGYSNEELKEITEHPDNLINMFGRNKLIK